MGKVINKTTNSYDGFIGKIQRKVSTTVHIIIIAFLAMSYGLSRLPIGGSRLSG